MPFSGEGHVIMSRSRDKKGAGDVFTSRSRDKLKTLCLHQHSAYGHQTRQDGNLAWWVPTHKVTLHFDHVVL